MRITLRTLLAYMDGILDPNNGAVSSSTEFKELAEQIEQSDPAQELIQRTREATRRLRLQAPGLDDANSGGFDANSVAEYLDSAATPDEVAAFERHCLESDSHLAEAASCHHILTMVLGERADIDPEARRRMYGIPEVAEAMAARSQPATTPRAWSSPPEAPPAASEPIREVPDYLRESPAATLSRWFPAIAALLLLGGVSYLAFSQGGWLRPTEIEDPGPIVLNNGGGGGDGGGGDEEPAAQQQDEKDPPDGEAGNQSTAGGADTQAEVADRGEQPAGPGDPVVVDSQPVDDLPPDPVAPTRSIDAPTGGGPAPDLTQPLAGPTESAAGPLGEGPVADDAGSMPLENNTPAPLDPELVAEADPGEVEPTPVGLLSSAKQVLLRFDDAEQDWRRLPARTAVLTGDRLLSLPTFRPTVTLQSGLTIELVDATRIRVQPPAADTPGSAGADTPPAGVTLEYGRLIVANAAGQPTELSVTIGDVRGTVEIEGLALLAIEAARSFTPGIDPAEVQAPITAACYAPRGGVAWSSAAGDLLAPEAAMWRIVGDMVGGVERLEEPVEWIDGRDLKGWDGQATREIEAKLNDQDPVWPQLMEIFGSKLKEQSKLAAISSAHVGHFDPFVRSLADENLRPAWEDEIATLRQTMAHSPELAEEVYASFELLHGQAMADDLYELLLGYTPQEIGSTPEQWRAGPIGKIVEWLGSPHQEYRALANYNLEQITGRRRVFDPTASSMRRESALRKLKSRLEKGDLRPTGAE